MAARASPTSAAAAHGDLHDVWIDPTNPQHVITGDDGGLWQSYDGGNKWWKQNNLPVSQFYHVSRSIRPIRTTSTAACRTTAPGSATAQYPGGITNSRWENMYGGDGFWMFDDPADPNYIYAEYQGGNIGRVNRTTHELRAIQPRPNYNEKLRWNWNTPIALSPNEKGTIYIGAQFLFRSRDHGQSWDRISPDLTHQRSGEAETGRIGRRHGRQLRRRNAHDDLFDQRIAQGKPARSGSAPTTATCSSRATAARAGRTSCATSRACRSIRGCRGCRRATSTPAPRSSRSIATRSATWRRISTRRRDYGKTWSALVSPKDAKGLRGYVHVIKQDPVKPELLYAGTEFGLWISIDGGKHWAQFKGGDFPAVAVRDMAFQNRDASLALATHGRGIWIIDDLTPLRALDAKSLDSEAAFLRRVRSSNASTRSAAGPRAMRASRGRIRRTAPRSRTTRRAVICSASSRSTSSTTRAR